MRPFFLLCGGVFIAHILAQSLFPAAVHVIHEAAALGPEAPEIAVYYRHCALKADKARLFRALKADKFGGFAVKILKVSEIRAGVHAQYLKAAVRKAKGKAHVLKLVKLRGDAAQRFFDIGEAFYSAAGVIAVLIDGGQLAVLRVPVFRAVFLRLGQDGKQKLRPVAAV